MRHDDPISDDEIPALFASLSDRPLALAVSGGADSVALMFLAQRWLELEPGWRPTSDQPRLLVLTVDHGLRPDSANDAAWVAARAKAAGLPCRVLTWTGDKPANGIQAAARAARYRLIADALADVAQAHGGIPRALVTAHHLDDQAETFLMRLARGSGVDGLSGMRATETIEIPQTAAGADGVRLDIHRPLLGVPKSRLVATLKAADLDWREDPSNVRDDFERIRIRKALAALTELGITGDTIARSAARLSRARDALRAPAEAAAHAIAWHDGAFGSIALAAFNDLPVEIAIRLLTRLIDAYGGEAPDPQLSEVEALVDRIRTTSDRAWPARAATLGGCRLDWRPRGSLRVWREAGRAALPTLAISPGATKVWDRRFRITAAPGLDGPIDVRALGTASWSALKSEHPELAKLRLPPGAAATLPACRQGNRLLAVPGLPSPRSPLIEAEFAGGRDSSDL